MTRLLALIPGGIREQLLFLPALTALSDRVSHIDAVVEPQAQEAYQVSTLVDKVMPFDFEGRKGLADWSNLFGKVRESEYDAVITTSQGSKIRFFLWLVGIPMRVGFGGGFGDFVMSDLVNRKDQQPLSDCYGDLLPPFGLSLLAPASLSLHIRESDQAWANGLQTSLSLDSGRSLVLLYDADGESPETYPLQSWKAVVAGLRDRQPDAQIALLQYGQNQAWVEALQELCGVMTVIDAPHLGQAAAMIEKATWLIATDSTPLYVGAGTPTSVVGLLGPTVAYQQLLECDRCQGLKAASGRLKDISPIQILEALS